MEEVVIKETSITDTTGGPLKSLKTLGVSTKRRRRVEEEDELFCGYDLEGKKKRDQETLCGQGLKNKRQLRFVKK